MGDFYEKLDNYLTRLESSYQPTVNTLSATVNKPLTLTISSQNARTPQLFTTQTDNSYSSFTVDLSQRAIIGAKSIQLTRAVIPQCNPSISDNALVFYYYRLTTQTDVNGDTFYSELPNIYNLYCIRLLPSYYKQELIATPSQYGFNQTFNSYKDLLVQLNLATLNDLAYNNQVVKTFPFIPGDITFSISNNKFQVTGNNINTVNPFPIYNATYIYQQNNLLTYNGVGYICKNNNVTGGNTPDTNSNFQTYTQTTNFYTYLFAGFQDPNVLTLQGFNYNLSWNPYHQYLSGDLTYYNGHQYTATKPSQGFAPPNATYWTVGSANAVLISGINGLSQTWDFELLASIPGQPYYPKNLVNRTLNLILGFSWNGINFTSLLPQLITPSIYPLGSSAPILFNRLRPIPIYAQGTLQDYPQLTTGTYSADAFCNLVFSSIINIYTDIIGNVTLDSQKNTQLLSLIPMNAPNLGVLYYVSPLENPLELGHKDIYNITINLYAEDGLPYLISNNGICTFVFKLSYQ